MHIPRYCTNTNYTYVLIHVQRFWDCKIAHDKSIIVRFKRYAPMTHRRQMVDVNKKVEAKAARLPKKRFLNNLTCCHIFFCLPDAITWRAAKYWSVYEKSFSLLVRYLPPVPIGNSVAQRAREKLLSLRVAKTAWETRPQPLRSGFKKLRTSRLSTRSLPTRRAP